MIFFGLPRGVFSFFSNAIYKLMIKSKTSRKTERIRRTYEEILERLRAIASSTAFNCFSNSSRRVVFLAAAATAEVLLSLLSTERQKFIEN